MTKPVGLALAALLAALGSASAAETPTDAAPAAAGTPPAKVKYKAGKDVNFEELLIQGDLKRPELSIVTGNTQQGTDGLLRLRENFTDRITMDAGEELQ